MSVEGEVFTDPAQIEARLKSKTAGGGSGSGTAPEQLYQFDHVYNPAAEGEAPADQWIRKDIDHMYSGILDVDDVQFLDALLAKIRFNSAIKKRNSSSTHAGMAHYGAPCLISCQYHFRNSDSCNSTPCGQKHKQSGVICKYHCTITAGLPICFEV